MCRIIYYPFINLPEQSWTYRQLLYFDEIVTIVPREYIDDSTLYTKHMRELIREGLVCPQNHSYDYDIQNELHVQFFRYLRSNNLDCRRINFVNPRYAIGRNDCGGLNPYRTQIFNTKFNPENGINSQIYNSKFGPAILEELRELGLALQGNNNIYYVEKETAFELMQFLTSLIGDKINAYPTTDTFPFFGVRDRQEVIIRERNEKRDVLLKSIMPVPEEIDFAHLMRFKEKHHDLLNRFRTEVESIVLDDAMQLSTERFDITVNRIIDQRDELIRKMEGFNFRRILKYSVHGMIPFVQAALEGEFNRNVMITGALTFMAAIAQAIHNLHCNRIENTSGMKYLALANKTFNNPFPL
ncbi:hypothetical protein LJC45_01080 [Alistipes sp. OttesenSCG-928-B03]|nr:hypothetical protein [Alistipes sp. OttesenSCG-928-B03]